MTAGVFEPSLYLSQGWLFEPASWWPVVALVVGIPALAVAARSEWQRGERFNAALGACCLAVLGAGLLSALSVRGRIGDYQLFWLTVVGAMSAAVVTTAAARRFLALPAALVPYASAAMCAGMLLVSYTAFVARTNSPTTTERETVIGL